MNIKKIGQYTLISRIKPINQTGEIRQIYKDNSPLMTQLLITDSFIKKTISDTSRMESVFESITNKLNGITTVLYDIRKK